MDSPRYSCNVTSEGTTITATVLLKSLGSQPLRVLPSPLEIVVGSPFPPSSHTITLETFGALGQSHVLMSFNSCIVDPEVIQKFLRT